MANKDLERLTEEQRRYMKNLPECITENPEAAMLITVAKIGDVVKINLNEWYSEQTGRGDLGIWIRKTEDIPESVRHKTRPVKSLVGYFSSWDGYAGRCIEVGPEFSPKGNYSTMFEIPVSAIKSYEIIEERAKTQS